MQRVRWFCYSGRMICVVVLSALFFVVQICEPVNGEFHCQAGEWWNASGICTTCTKCPEVVLRTCQPHKDTVCGSFNDIHIQMNLRPQEVEEEGTIHPQIDHFWEWFEISLAVAAVTAVIFVFAALYMIHIHRRQWNKMQEMDNELEQDISRLMGKLAEVPNIQKTTAVLVDENQIKKQEQKSGHSSFRWIYLDQLLGKNAKGSPKRGNVYTERRIGRSVPGN